MKITRPTPYLLLVSSFASALAVWSPDALGSAMSKGKAPLVKSFTYTALPDTDPEKPPVARYTASVKLSATVTAIDFEIDSANSTGYEAEAAPEHAPKSYSAGVHEVIFNYDALPAGTFKITLLAHVNNSSTTIKCSDPVTLLVEEVPEGQVGKGTVKKI